MCLNADILLVSNYVRLAETILTVRRRASGSLMVSSYGRSKTKTLLKQKHFSAHAGVISILVQTAGRWSSEGINMPAVRPTGRPSARPSVRQKVVPTCAQFFHLDKSFLFSPRPFHITSFLCSPKLTNRSLFNLPAVHPRPPAVRPTDRRTDL